MPRLPKAVQARLDNPSSLTDAQRIANLEVFESDCRYYLKHGNGPMRKQARESLLLLDALRARQADAEAKS